MSQVWLITGASSGFGGEFVKQLIDRGDKVIATARNVAKIEHLKKVGAAVLQLHITAPQSELDAKAQEAIDIYGHVDVLVNNAAYVLFGTQEETSFEDLFKQFNTNVFGTMNVTRSLLPHYRSRKAGTLVFIGSIASWSGAAVVGPYCGTKFALRGLVESLEQEVKPFGIRTLLVEPGYFRTELLGSNNAIFVPEKVDDYKSLTDATYDAFRSTNGKQPGDPVKGVARIIDVVKETGPAEGRTMPGFLALGDDAVVAIRDRCEQTLKALEEWEDLSKGTNL